MYGIIQPRRFMPKSGTKLDVRLRGHARCRRGTCASRVGGHVATSYGKVCATFDGAGQMYHASEGIDLGTVGSSTFTIRFWMCATDDLDDDAIISISNDGSTGITIMQEGTYGLQVLLTDGSADDGWYTADNVITQNTWHYVVVTVQGLAVSVSIDGEAVSLTENDWAATWRFTNTGISLGDDWPADGTHDWTGRLAAVGVYLGAVLPDGDDYDHPQPRDVSGYAAFWRLNDGVSAFVIDHSGNGHHLTVDGADWDDTSANLGEDEVNYNTLTGLYTDTGDYYVRHARGKDWAAQSKMLLVHWFRNGVGNVAGDRIISCESADNTGWRLEVGGTEDDLAFKWGFATGDIALNHTAKAPVGELICWVAVIEVDGSAAYSYVNGADEQSDTAFSGAPNAVNGDYIKLGARADADADFASATFGAFCACVLPAGFTVNSANCASLAQAIYNAGPAGADMQSAIMDEVTVTDTASYIAPHDDLDFLEDGGANTLTRYQVTDYSEIATDGDCGASKHYAAILDHTTCGDTYIGGMWYQHGELDHWQVADHVDLRPEDGDFDYAQWFHARTGSATGRAYRFIDKYHDDEEDWGLLYHHLNVGISVLQASGGPNLSLFVMDSTLPTGMTLVRLHREGTIARAYFGADVEGIDATASGDLNTSGPLKIGGYDDSSQAGSQRSRFTFVKGRVLSAGERVAFRTRGASV